MWQQFLEWLAEVNAFVNDLVWGWPVIIMILGTGILLTVRTKALQLRKFGYAMKTTIIKTLRAPYRKSGEKQTGVSQFEAFSAAISGTVGTGNIIGVTSAVLTGGPGAVFWMWVSAFFGMITNYAENVLGLYFRRREENGEFSGGAMYYIYYGLKWKWLAYVASVFCVLAAIGMSGVQTNKISSTLSGAFGTSLGVQPQTLKLIIGIVVALLAAAVIIGGIKRIGRVASMLVPFMSLIFMVGALVIIGKNITSLPGAFGSIFRYAFNFKAAGSGIFGYGFAQVIRKGMARGVFSNEAGLGSSVIAHSASETREPVKQGLWGVFEVFFDTFVICTLSALTLLCSTDLNALTGKEIDTDLSMAVFSDNFGVVGTVMSSIILPLFAFTTILAWSYYGEKATDFLFRRLSKKGRKIAVTTFKVVYVGLIVVSAMTESELAWALSDTANGLMALPNLICVVALSGLVTKITKNYFARKKERDLEPMLSAYPEQNELFKGEILSGPEEFQ